MAGAPLLRGVRSPPDADTGASASLYYACQLGASLSISRMWRGRVMSTGMMNKFVNVCLMHQQQRPYVEEAWTESAD